MLYNTNVFGNVDAFPWLMNAELIDEYRSALEELYSLLADLSTLDRMSSKEERDRLHAAQQRCERATAALFGTSSSRDDPQVRVKASA